MKRTDFRGPWCIMYPVRDLNAPVDKTPSTRQNVGRLKPEKQGKDDKK